MFLMQVYFASCSFEYKEMTTVGHGALAITLGIFRLACWLWTAKTTFSKKGLITCRACEWLWCLVSLCQKSPQRYHCAQNTLLWSKLIQGQHHKPVSSTTSINLLHQLFRPSVSQPLLPLSHINAKKAAWKRISFCVFAQWYEERGISLD